MINKGFVEFQAKSIQTTDEFVTIEGYASVSVVDRQGDLVKPESIDLADYMKNPIVLWQHKQDNPVGKVIDLRIDSKGLYVKAEIYKSLDEKVFNAVKNSIVKTFSIGFGGQGQYDNNIDAFVFEKVKLYEISVVSIPANQDALFSVVKFCEDGKCIMKRKSMEEVTKAQGENLGRDKINQIISQNQNSRFGDKLIGSSREDELVVNVTPNSVLTAYPNPPKGYVVRRYMQDENVTYDFVIGKSEVAKLLALMRKYFKDDNSQDSEKELEEILEKMMKKLILKFQLKNGVILIKLN